MANAGHKALVRVTGSPLTLTDELTTTSDNLTYQITDPAKRVLGPDSTIVVEIDPEGDASYVVADPSTYKLDRLTGKVVFSSVQPEIAEVIVSGEYLPLANVMEAYEFSYSLEGNNETANIFSSQYVRRKQTLKDATGSIGKFEDVNETLFYDALENDRTFLLEFYYDSSLGADLRAWAKVASDEKSAAVDGLQEDAIEWEGTTDKDGRMVSIG